MFSILCRHSRIQVAVAQGHFTGRDGLTMTKSLEKESKSLLDRLHAAPALFCGLDYDGTLAPIAPTPDAAVPYPGTERLLRKLSATGRVRLAIVTGRSIEDVRGFLDLEDAYYVGIHGLELKRPGEDVTDSAAGRRARAVLPRFVEDLRARIGSREGLLVEEKGAAVALHFRLANDEDKRFGRDAVQQLVDRLCDEGETLDLLDGHEVVEVRPAGVDKGRALCELLASDGKGALPIYIGDDRTDEDAFRALPDSAVTIRVGPEGTETAARYLVPDPKAVHRFLTSLAEEV